MEIPEIPGAKIKHINIGTGGGLVELYRAPFLGHFYVIVPCRNIADYATTEANIELNLPNFIKPSRLERLTRKFIKPIQDIELPIIEFVIDDVVIDDVKVSEYETSSNDILPLCGRAPITIRRMDYVFKDSTKKMLGYLELNASNNSPMWSTAVFSQQGDRTKIRVNMSSQQIPLCAEIIKIENYSLVERLLSKTPSYAGR